MAPSQDELEALKAQVAQLTARIYKLEQQTGLAAGILQQQTPIAEGMRPTPEESALGIRRETPRAGTVQSLPPLPSIPPRKPVTPAIVRQIEELAKENTPTRVIGGITGRTEASVRNIASTNHISLKPTNQSPNKGKR